MFLLREQVGARRLIAVALAAALCAALTAPVASAQVDAPEPRTPATSSPAEEISDDTLARLISSAHAMPPEATAHVEVFGADLDAVSAAVTAAGGEVTGYVDGYFIEAIVPVGALESIYAHEATGEIYPLTRSSPTATTVGPPTSSVVLQNVVRETIKLAPWHDAGHLGAGQKIGIIDHFGETELERSIALKRLPPIADMFCRNAGRPCQLASADGGSHGVGVAEIIHAIAPDAELYLATVRSQSDTREAVEWFAANDVTVVNRSVLSELDGPGDGTGPMASIVDLAVAQGIVWVTAAGNAAGDPRVHPGENWVGTFNDPDGNGVHNWRNGSERMPFDCGFILGMRWDDWDTNTIPTDYDILVYDNVDDLTPEASGQSRQRKASHQPLERGIDTTCVNGPLDTDYISIVMTEDLQPDGVDELQILTNRSGLGEWVNEHSATLPGADSKSPGVVSVGASTSPSSLDVASYSSEGPTFDGRSGVDLVAPSCIPGASMPGCFTGTSAASPVVAGIMAMFRGAGVFTSTDQVDAVIDLLTVDAGVPGRDPVYGQGSMILRSPEQIFIQDTLPRCFGLPATIVGTPGDDVIVGTPGVDIVFARQGDDQISTIDGNDIICGGFGDDQILAGTGADVILAGPGADTVRGQAGNDFINGGHGHDDIEGNEGTDELRGYTGRDYVKGGNGNDDVFGGAGNDRLVGGNGNDQLFGGEGLDRCRPPLEEAVSCR